jgi:putative copper resistance protein D
MIIAFMFLAMIFVSFYKKVSPWIALGFGVIYIIGTYLGLMMSLMVG